MSFIDKEAEASEESEELREEVIGEIETDDALREWERA